MLTFVPMFTGIIEAIGNIRDVQKSGNNILFSVESPFTSELKPDQSVAHNGVCLTVKKTDKQVHLVEAVQETINRTDLASWKAGTQMNLERCLKTGDRLDGHFVQGHVDTTALVESVTEEGGSWRFRFACREDPGGLLVEKGSVAINGVSLTVAYLSGRSFEVVIIPYTLQHTTFGMLKKGDITNIEFDILGKYIRGFVNTRQA